MEQSPTLEHFRVARPVPVARITAGHFIMAVALLVLGYFLIWPIILLLINSFNAATDWFVEPRVWGCDTGRTRSYAPVCLDLWGTPW